VHVAVEPDLPAQSVETIPRWHRALCWYLIGLRVIRSVSWQVSPTLFQLLRHCNWRADGLTGAKDTGWCCANICSQACLFSATHLFWSDCTWLMRKDTHKHTYTQTHTEHIALSLFVTHHSLSAGFTLMPVQPCQHSNAQSLCMVRASNAGTAKSHSAHILVKVTFWSYSPLETKFSRLWLCRLQHSGFKRQVPVLPHPVDGGRMYLRNVDTSIKPRGVIALSSSWVPRQKGTFNL